MWNRQFDTYWKISVKGTQRHKRSLKHLIKRQLQMNRYNIREKNKLNFSTNSHQTLVEKIKGKIRLFSERGKGKKKKNPNFWDFCCST